MSDHSEMVSRYKRLRRIGTAMNNALVRTLAKDVLEEGGRKLGIIRDGTFVFASQDETNVLMDYCIYGVRRNGVNAIERCLADSPPAEGSEEMLLLRAKTQARYSIFQVEKVIAGVGVEMLDVFRQDRVFVVDMGFGQTAVVGLMLASRLISVGDFWVTGGAALPLSKGAADEIRRRLPGLLGADESDWDHMPFELEADFVAMVVRACLENRDGPKIRYEQPELPAAKPPAARPLSRPLHVGRNAPCPCGSGRKYKRCCGRK